MVKDKGQLHTSLIRQKKSFRELFLIFNFPEGYKYHLGLKTTFKRSTKHFVHFK